MKFKDLHKQYNWRPIKGCPGRYVLIRSDKDRFGELYRTLENINSYKVPSVADEVLVYSLEDGGLISYVKSDGFILHTLGDAYGFKKKIEKLGISPADSM